ncbi:MAG: SPOR domain-containing protein [Alphaproteobacteria bacterium]|nr:SPOR domain-containing protein [Alphaproteobacteria bacterium]
MTPATRPTIGLSRNRVMLLAGSTLAFSLLAGCGGMHGVKSANAAQPDRLQAEIAAKADKAVARAELAVERSPEDAAARASLGQAYLVAGRFGSATTALDDAMTLGDGSGKTALALALAKIGSGRHREAVTILDSSRAEIPAADLGLALALAGETSRAVAVLSDAVRSGENTPKLRQNLAYAFALDGRWQDARLMAAQDVPADQLDRRLAFWALSTLPDRNVERVAALIGAPVRQRDPGQPVALALASDPQAPQVAAETAALAPVALAAAELPATAPTTAEVAAPSVVEANLAVQSEPAVAPQEGPKSWRNVAQAFAPAEKSLVAAAEVAPAAPAPRHPARSAALVTTKAQPHVIRNPHYLQLGAFSTEQAAQRASGIYRSRNPGLAGHRMSIRPATVNGQQVWRVAVADLAGRAAATTLCSRVKSRGGACFAYAAPGKALQHPNTPGFEMTGPQRAR